MAALALAAFGSGAGAAAEPAETGESGCVVTEGRTEVSRSCDDPGQVITFAPSSDDVVGAEVPPEGRIIIVDAVQDDGSTLGMQVSNLAGDGVVASADFETGGGTGGPPRCTDNAYELKRFNFGDGVQRAMKWRETFVWKYRSSTTPPGIQSADAAEAINRGLANMTGASNDCGLADNVSATRSYDGTTAQGVDINAGTTDCNSADSSNVATFGDLGNNNTLAVACIAFYYQQGDGRGTITGADVKYDDTGHTWYIPGTTSCSSDWSLTAVATHEAGHVFGLSHVSEADHGYLTMSKYSEGTCSNAEASLGLGDVRGMEDLY